MSVSDPHLDRAVNATVPSRARGTESPSADGPGTGGSEPPPTLDADGWLFFDDAYVKLASLDKVAQVLQMSSATYMLFYRAVTL